MMKLLFRPIDAAILIYFRIIAGILLALELVNQLLAGKFDDYIAPKLNLSYMYFDWLKSWPYWGMGVHYSVTIFAALAVAFNYRYRFFSIILFLGYTSLFLMKANFYINHIYLYCLLTFWMMFLPLNKNRISAPAWSLYLIIFHLSLAFLTEGIAELNIKMLSGENFTNSTGLLLKLIVVPLMIIGPTKKFGIAISMLVHLSYLLMGGIGTFPWFSLLLTTLFFDPSWPRKIPLFRKFMPWNVELAREFEQDQVMGTFIIFYLAVNMAIPLRFVLSR